LKSDATSDVDNDAVDSAEVVTDFTGPGEIGVESISMDTSHMKKTSPSPSTQISLISHPHHVTTVHAPPASVTANMTSLHNQASTSVADSASGATLISNISTSSFQTQTLHNVNRSGNNGNKITVSGGNSNGNSGNFLAVSVIHRSVHFKFKFKTLLHCLILIIQNTFALTNLDKLENWEFRWRI
jgi:hypothetical protein